MMRMLLLLSSILLLSGCGDTDAQKNWKDCSYDVSKMVGSQNEKLEAQAYCDGQYESSITNE